MMIIAFVAVVLLFQINRGNGMEIECGTVNLVRPRILNGDQVLKGEWPFVAAIQNQSQYICGGTIISKKHIITGEIILSIYQNCKTNQIEISAAHCIQRKNSMNSLSPHEVVVRLGTYNLTETNEKGAVQRNVSEIFIHPDWDVYDDVFDADIAILVLTENITFTHVIKPACLPGEGFIRNVVGTVVGWGLTENLTYAEIPRKTTFRAINDSHCYRIDYGIASFSSARTFCGGGVGDGSPNRGDSGCGAYLISGNVWVLYGIVSVIRTNATGHIVPLSYSIYTNVTAFRSWISETVRQSGGVVGEAMINVNLKCDYVYSFDDSWVYGCWLNDLNIGTNTIEVVSFSGTHASEKTDQDVELLVFTNGTMAFLPNGFGNVFRNLKYLTVGDLKSLSLGTKRIRQSNFRNLENLLELSLLFNEIEILDEDSLLDLPELQIFRIVNNKLQVLHEETFARNAKLKEIYLNSNQLSYVSGSVFRNNLLLEKVDFRKNFLKTVDETMFETNLNLIGVSFVSNRLEVLPKHLFKNNLALKLVDFRENSLSMIDESLFETNVKLTAVSFSSNKLKSLPGSLFINNLLLDVVDFENNSLRFIPDKFFEQNTLLKYVYFSSNVLLFLQRSLFKNNLLLEWLDFFNNYLYIIDTDFTVFRNVERVDLQVNYCINATYTSKDSRNTKHFKSLREFQSAIRANCSSGDF